MYKYGKASNGTHVLLPDKRNAQILSVQSMYSMRASTLVCLIKCAAHSLVC